MNTFSKCFRNRVLFNSYKTNNTFFLKNLVKNNTKSLKTKLIKMFELNQNTKILKRN